MKKIILILATLSILSGCSKTLTCTKNTSQQDVEITYEVKITHKDNYVTKTKTTETIKAPLENLEIYSSVLDEVHGKFDNLDHYKYEIETKSNQITSTATINFEKIDISTYLKIDNAFQDIIKDNKIALKDIKKYYTDANYTCK